VRLPVYVGHCLSMNVTFAKRYEVETIREILAKAPGVVLADDPATHTYPMPITVAGTDNVYVGRIRRDFSVENGLNLWVAADNTRKGAATNAVQILEALRGMQGLRIK